MDDNQYLDIILSGIKKHRKYLKEHLIREQKKAQERFVEFEEFKNRLLDLIRSINLESRWWKFLTDIQSMTIDEALDHSELTKLNVLRSKNRLLISVSANRDWTESDISELMISVNVVVDAFIEAFKFDIDKNAVDLPELQYIQKEENDLLFMKTNTIPSEKIDDVLHDPNLWNLGCFQLFIYLFDNYYKGKKRELTNIWFYLKEYDPRSYTLLCTKNDYKSFIKNYCGVTLKNFDKAYVKYIEKDRPIMDAHRIQFENITNDCFEYFDAHVKNT